MLNQHQYDAIKGLGLALYAVNEITEVPVAKKTKQVVARSVFEGGAIKLSSCFYCNSNTWLTRDHFFPKSKGGRLTVTCCYECNQLKADLTPRQWIIFAQREQIVNYERIVAQTENLLKEVGWSILQRVKNYQ